jgi:hypothetical protein
MSMKRRHELYRIYDGNGVLLYIGRSLNSIARASQHRVTKSWWHTVARIDIEQFVTTDEGAGAREAAAIATEKPLHNVAHNLSRKAERLPLVPGSPLPPPMAHQRIRSPRFARARAPHVQLPWYDDRIAGLLGSSPMSARAVAQIVDCSPDTAAKALKRLSEQGRAMDTGRGWGARDLLTHDTYAATPAERVVAHLDGDTMTVEEVMAWTELKRSSAYDLMARMVSEGRARKVTGGWVRA